MVALGCTLYALNVAVGLGAQLGGLRFGVWHHVLYGVVFASAVVATLVAFHPALLVTLVALAAFPWARPRTPWHPLLAVVGLAGYAMVLLFPME